ncbi:MAG: hypothetical protein RSD40_04410, partial [Bacilli bacterium]
IVDALSYTEYETKLLDSSKVDFIEANRISSIVEEIRRKIRANQYVIIFVDQYYIKNSIGYNRRHYPHEVLIYGYDKEGFKTIAFDKKQLFSFFDISNEEIKCAFKGVLDKKIWNSSMELEENIIFYFNVVNHTDNYPFNTKNFKDKLYRYCQGEMKKEDVYLKKYYQKEDHNTLYVAKGINTYDIFIDYFEKVSEVADKNPIVFMEYIDSKYTFFHLFAQHKEGLYRRFKYIEDNYIISEEFPDLVRKYKMISEEIIKLKMGWLKLIAKMARMLYEHKDITYIREYSVQTIKLFRDILIEMKDQEEKVIRKILGQLEEF